MTYEEAIRVRDRASFEVPSRVDWAKVEQAVEVIARRHVEVQRADTPEYDRAVRSGGFVACDRGGRRTRYRAPVESNDDLPDEPPPGWPG